ncbi:MAG: hypothetical protein Kow0042_26170 [Calditrichia bacterium]
MPPLPRNPEPLAPPQVEEKISGLFPSKKAHREVHSRPSSAADPAMLPPRTSGDINEEEELIDLADKIRRILEDEAKRFGINI